MVRALVGSALVLSALGMASALIGPSLSGSPGGEPMIVGGAEFAAFHEANFEADCLPSPLLDPAPSATQAENASPLALEFHDGGGAVAVVTGDGTKSAVAAEDTLIVILDPSGQVRAAGSASFQRNWVQPIRAGICPGSDLGRPGLI